MRKNVQNGQNGPIGVNAVPHVEVGQSLESENARLAPRTLWILQLVDLEIEIRAWNAIKILVPNGRHGQNGRNVQPRVEVEVNIEAGNVPLQH